MGSSSNQRRIAFTAAARAEILQIFRYYTQIGDVLAERFRLELARVEAVLIENPYLFQIVDDALRRVNLRRFPYFLIYEVTVDEVTVVACLHHHRRPRTREELTER